MSGKAQEDEYIRFFPPSMLRDQEEAIAAQKAAAKKRKIKLETLENLESYEAYPKHHIENVSLWMLRKYGRETPTEVWVALWKKAGLSIKQIRWLLNEHVHGNLNAKGQQFRVNRQWTTYEVERKLILGETALQAQQDHCLHILKLQE
jgi:hypothetical protein